MTYAVFQYDRKSVAQNKIVALSLLFLTPESQLKGFDSWHSDLNTQKLSSININKLSGYLACCDAQVSSVSIIKFPYELDTDKYLLKFGNTYLGCINVKLKKSDLIDRVKLIQTFKRNHYLNNWLTVEIDSLENKLKSVIGLDENEIVQLRNIENSHGNPYEKWIKNRENQLKESISKTPKFLKRNF